MKKNLSLLLSSLLLGGCSLVQPIEKSGNVSCESKGVVVFSGTVQMTGETLVDEAEFPSVWVFERPDIRCRIEFAEGDVMIE